MPLSGDAKREYQRQWLANRRANFFSDKSCIQCGSTESLELDHIDPEQKVTHRVWSWSQERRDAEIAKCQILCGDCHKPKTAAYVRELHGYAEKKTCERGHPLELVGTYDKKRNGGGCCRYCQHLANAALRGGTIKPIDQFIKESSK